MKTLTLILATFIALPTALTCEPAPSKRSTFVQWITDHSKALFCGACAIVIGYFLLRKPAQPPVTTQTARKPTPPIPPVPPVDNEGDVFDLLLKEAQSQRVVEFDAAHPFQLASSDGAAAQKKAQNDLFARQREKHAQHCAKQEAQKRATQEKRDAELAAKLGAEQPNHPVNSFDNDVNRPPLEQKPAESLLNDVN